MLPDELELLEDEEDEDGVEEEWEDVARRRRHGGRRRGRRGAGERSRGKGEQRDDAEQSDQSLLRVSSHREPLSTRNRQGLSPNLGYREIRAGPE